MPKRKETVELQVGSSIYTAWESIQATAEFGSTRDFAFMATEAISKSGGNSSPNWNTLQIRPGDECRIKFAGELFLTGVVNCRNAQYNAVQHNVLISGKSTAGRSSDMSCSMKDVGGGQFIKMKWSAIADAIWKPSGIKWEMKGSTELSELPFDDAQINPGETDFNFLGRLARHRGITLYDDENGKWIALADPQGGGGGSLIEGQNIQSATCRIENTTIFRDQITLGQINGSDEYWGRRAAQVAAHANTPGETQRKPYLLIGDRRLTTKEAQGRLDYENLWNFNDNIAADIVVYGWQADSGELWKVGDQVHVDSPMLMLKGTQLYIQRATFTQDNDAGSLTNLHLVSRLGIKAVGLNVPGSKPATQAKPGSG